MRKTTSKILSDAGTKGGEVRAAKLSPKRRSDIAAAAARARWGKRKGTGRASKTSAITR